MVFSADLRLFLASSYSEYLKIARYSLHIPSNNPLKKNSQIIAK